MRLQTREASAFKENFEAIADVLAQNNLLGFNRGVEIGVRHGIFSEHLLEKFPELVMWCVDPYLPYMDVGEEFTQEMQSEIRKGAFRRLSRFGNRVAWCYQRSTAAASSLFTRGSMDFAFIDAEHSYQSVCADLDVWAPVVRPAGLLCGHDYGMGGVRRAVNEFAEDSGLLVHHIGAPADVWMMVLP